MVHRSADARLLSNLVSHEKDYSKQLQALLTASQASLGSLTAYAAASPPATSRTILNVAAILAAADSAHQRYASAVEEWRDMLRGLHALEEEVANVIRDREILVTRLIKASKSSTRSSSSSTSHLRSPSGSSLNLNAIPGTSTKLAAAQSELQACETHLAAKERELDIRRVQVIRDGLILRGRAMSETGWTWSQLGREAINTVENELVLRTDPQQHQQHRQNSRLVEDMKSGAESVSTHASSSFPGGYPASSSEDSGGRAGELNIPAAHAISSEIDMPIPVMNSASSAPSRRNSTTLSPRNSMSVHGPQVPSKRNSFLATKASNSNPTPRHSRLIETNVSSDLPLRPHLQHVAPHGRASWVSVTDTEEDWADAGEGGEELDAAFGRPSSNPSSSKMNGNTDPSSSSPPHSTHPNPPLSSNKDLPPPPPLNSPSSKYPFVSAPGSIFDSEAYRGAKEELASRPTSMVLSSYEGPPPPVVRVPSSPSGHVYGYLQVPQPKHAGPTTTVASPPSMMDENETEEGNGDGDGRRSTRTIQSNRTSEASEVEYVGKATRHNFKVGVEDHPTVLATVPASPLSVVGAGAAEEKERERDVAGEANLGGSAPIPMKTPTTLVHAMLRNDEREAEELLEDEAVPAAATSEEDGEASRLTKKAKQRQRRKEKGKQRMTEAEEEEEMERESEQREVEEEVATTVTVGMEVVEVKKNTQPRVVEVVEVTSPVSEHQGVVEVVKTVQAQIEQRAEEDEEESMDQDEEDRLVREGLLTVVENPKFSSNPTAASASEPSPQAVETAASSTHPSNFVAAEVQQAPTPPPAPVPQTLQSVPAPAVAVEETANVTGEGKQTGEKKKEKKRSSVMAALFHPMGGSSASKVEQKEDSSLREEREAEVEEPVTHMEVENVLGTVPPDTNGTTTSGAPPPIDVSASPVAAPTPLAPVAQDNEPQPITVRAGVFAVAAPPPQKRSVFGRLFGRGRSGSMSKEKGKERLEQLLNEVASVPPVPPIPPQAVPAAVVTTVVSATPVAEVAPTPAPAPASAPTPAPAAVPVPAPVPAPAPALPAPAPVSTATETTTTTVEEMAVAPQPAAPIVQQPQIVPSPEPASAPAMPEPAPCVPPQPAVAVVQASSPEAVAASPPPIATTTTTTAPPSKSKLSKKKTAAAAIDESPTKTHHHGGFFGGFRKGSKKKGGEEAVATPPPPRTATETVWAQPSVLQQGVTAAPVTTLPPSSASVEAGAGGSVASSSKQQRRASKGGTLATLFGLNHHQHTLKKDHHVLTKGDGGDGEAAGGGGEAGPQYQVYVNEEDLETRREKLRMQHEAGTHQHHRNHSQQSEGSSTTLSRAGTTRSQGRMERRTLVQPGGHQQHHSRSQSEGVVLAPASTVMGAQQEDRVLDSYRSASPTPALVSVQAPGPVNLEEIQAQARMGMSSFGSGGWSTRTEKNLKELKSDSWRDEQLTHLALAGGGVGRGIPRQFEPVILPDLSDRALRGVEGVQRPPPQRVTTNPMEYVAKYGAGTGATREGAAGLERNVSVMTAGSGRAGAKLKKGRSSSVPPESEGVKVPPPFTAPQREAPKPFPGSQNRKELNEEVGTGTTRGVIKPRRSTSLTTGAPHVVAAPAQNQYGATVLTAGGENVSGKLTRGGWGANQGASLSRNTSVKSNATAPVGGQHARIPKAQAHTSLGQGMPTSVLGSATPPRRPSGGGPYPLYGASQSMVDITPVSGSGMNGAGPKTARTEKRTSVPSPMPNVPGAVTGTMPMTVPKAPPPTSTLLQSWPGPDSSGGGVLMPKAGGPNSLLSIVEDVARGNRQAEERLRVLKSGGAMDLEVVQAPTRVHREMLTGAVGNAAATSKPYPSSNSGGSTTSLSQGSGLGRRPSTRPAQVPLKSALRHPSMSRTPSPSNVHRRQSVNVPVDASGGRFTRKDDDGDDSAYETPGEISGEERGRQLSDAKGKGPIQTTPPPVRASNAAGFPAPILPSSDDPAAVHTPSETPHRKKSVRVSLQPTFSPTPPTIYDDDEDQRVFWKPLVPDKPVRNKSRFLTQSLDGPLTSTPGASTSAGAKLTSTSKVLVRDIWQDSDEEDEEYMKARMRLSRALEEERTVFATARATAAFA